MKLKEHSSEEKLRGVYYTPLQLAKAIVAMVDMPAKATVLEPSCGDGVFLDALFDVGKMDACENCLAIEIDHQEADAARQRYKKSKNVKIETSDFFDYYEENKDKRFDLILGNPPYIRYQYLTETQRREMSQILEASGMRTNKLINAWVCFVVACSQLLAPSGKLAFVIPSEILQVAYAEDLRLFLSTQFRHLTLLTFKKLVFPDIEQEVVTLIAEKGVGKTEIRIVELDDLSSLSSLDLSKIPFTPIPHSKEKWTQYFTNADEDKILRALRKDKRFAPFSDFGIINVGVTTGNNDFFSIDEKVKKLYALDSVLLPLIGRSSHAHGIYFTEADWQRNCDSAKKANLLVFPDVPFGTYPDKHKAYIRYGEQTLQNTGYKCSIRDRWYIVPSIWIPDAFFLRRNNEYPKFVLNKCGAISTDTMHRMKFNADVDPEILLLSYYNSVSFAFTEICGRSYGGGVLEILPGEMGKILVPKINTLNASLKRELLQHVDQVVRTNVDIEKALDVIDKRLLVDTLGIDPELCTKCRAVWRKLQGRRLGRGNVSTLNNNKFPEIDERAPVQMTFFDPEKLYVVNNSPITLLGTYRKRCRDWIVQKNLYNYPVTDAELNEHFELRAVRYLVLKRQKDEPLYFAVKGSSIVSKADLKNLDYKPSKIHHAKTKYILYKLKKLKAPIQSVKQADAYIVGKGLK